MVDVKAAGGKIILTPIPSADDEYTPEQRRLIDAKLTAAEKTPLHDPFKDGDEIVSYLKAFEALKST